MRKFGQKAQLNKFLIDNHYKTFSNQSKMSVVPVTCGQATGGQTALIFLADKPFGKIN